MVVSLRREIGTIIHSVVNGRDSVFVSDSVGVSVHNVGVKRFVVAGSRRVRLFRAAAVALVLVQPSIQELFADLQLYSTLIQLFVSTACMHVCMCVTVCVCVCVFV